MRFAFDPGPRPRGLDAFLGEIPDALFDDRTFACCELVARYADDLALDLARRLNLAPALARGASTAELASGLSFADSFRPALESLLGRLAAAGELERSPCGCGAAVWVAPRPLREPELAELRARGLELDPAMAPSLDLLDAAAAAYPAVAAGLTTGEHELFSAGRIALWLGYFSNRNPVYALNNLQTAVVAARRLGARPGARVLEVGGGAGSFSVALLEELDRQGRLADLALYDFTEPSPFFRRRGERELHARFPGVALRARGLDIDLPYEEQGPVDGPYDLAVGVNVLHVARDLVATLTRLREALRPGGWLVAGECLRLFPDQPVPADLVFQIFRSFTEVSTDPELRPSHGFLEPSSWRRALAAAGFEEVSVVPDLDRIRDLYPRFFAGVVLGRRPL